LKFILDKKEPFLKMFSQSSSCNLLNTNTDYYPFGMIMPGRKSPLIAGDEHRFGYQGSEMDDEVKGEHGTSYTTFFRQYDPRVGRWLSLDSKDDKFPSISPYVYAMNNPLSLIDEEGDEPNVAQATSLEGFVQYLKENKLTTSHDIYIHLKNNSTTVPRYIYTQDKGWIDMNHVFCVIENGYHATNLLEPISGNAMVRENLLGEGAANSYYSYEDLPSNKVGEQVRKRIVAEERGMDPPAGVIAELKGKDLYNVITLTIGTYGAVNPEEAPNYRMIPANKDRDVVMKNGQVQELTKVQLATGKYVPQNFTNEPYDLKGFPQAPTSLNATEWVEDPTQKNNSSDSKTENIGSKPKK